MFFNIFFIILLALALLSVTIISTTDYRRRIIPDLALFPLLLIGLILTTFYGWPIDIATGVIGATFGYVMSTIIGILFERHLRRKRPDVITSPIGMGDIKLISVGGLWLGTTGLGYALFIACLLGALWSYRKSQHYIPFAPFFITGAILTLIARPFLL